MTSLAGDRIESVEAAVAAYLRTVQMPRVAGFEVDIAPNHPARRDGFVATRLGSGPPLLFLPGLHADDVMLWANRAALARHMTVVSMRYRQTGTPTPEQYGGDIVTLLDMLDLESAHLVGESMGSIPALWLAIHHPARVRSLALVAGFARTPGPAKMALALTVRATSPGAVFRGMFGLRIAAVQRQAGRLGHFTPEVVRAFVGQRRALQRAAVMARLRMIARWDCTTQLESIRCPFLYLGGTGDLTIATRRESARFASCLPEATTVLLPGGPHLVLIARPPECERALIDHVSRAERLRRAPH